MNIVPDPLLAPVWILKDNTRFQYNLDDRDLGMFRDVSYVSGAVTLNTYLSKVQPFYKTLSFYSSLHPLQLNSETLSGEHKGKWQREFHTKREINWINSIETQFCTEQGLWLLAPINSSETAQGSNLFVAGINRRTVYNKQHMNMTIIKIKWAPDYYFKNCESIENNRQCIEMFLLVL